MIVVKAPEETKLEVPAPTEVKQHKNTKISQTRIKFIFRMIWSLLSEFNSNKCSMIKIVCKVIIVFVVFQNLMINVSKHTLKLGVHSCMCVGAGQHPGPLEGGERPHHDDDLRYWDG